MLFIAEGLFFSLTLLFFLPLWALKLSAAIRDQVVSDAAPLTFSLKKCMLKRDSQGGNNTEDSKKVTVICERKTLVAFKEVMS